MRLIISLLQIIGGERDVIVLEQTKTTFKKVSVRKGLLFFKSGIEISESDDLMASEVGQVENQIIGLRLEN